MSALYTLEILRLATSAADFPRLAAPDGTVERRAVPCGSRIIMDLTLDDAGVVTAMGMDLRACALGQASAVILARGIIGCSASDLVSAGDALRQYLHGDTENAGDWPGVAPVLPARGYVARHGAVLLAFEAAAQAAVIQMRAA